MKGFLGKIKATLSGARLGDGLARTREKLSENVRRVLGGRTRLDAGDRDALEETLLAADVGVAATERLLTRLETRVRDQGLSDGETLEDVFAEEVVAILREAEGDRNSRAVISPPRVVLLVGVNGTGKTTTLGKLAHLYSGAGESVLIGAADTFRAAAVDQVRIWAERSGSECISGQPGADPAAVAHDAVARARSRNVDVVLIDTAGRLQTKTNLMEELAKITRVIQKQIPDAPHEVLLVLDATTGQNALSQARHFEATAGVTGL
ncbi:MAG TPA: signaling recognition particle receptor family protein, partial [Candidatus Eisenbacteria bacterium]|nr:signaling recognition particle receptor family protein [Candidatus Eisenbacteria bacterium]